MSADAARVSDGLVRLGVRQPIVQYARSLWGRRSFTMELALSDVRSAHMSSVLGQAWHLLNPALSILVYYLVFGVALDANRGVDNYITFLVIGVMLFRLMQEIIVQSARSISRNTGMIRAIQFPRAAIPISVTISEFYKALPGLGLVLVVAVLDGTEPRWQWALLPMVLGAGLLLSFGFGLTAAKLGSEVDDLYFVLPHAFRILFYASGVLFSVEVVVQNEFVKSLFPINPFYDVLVAARWCLMGGPIRPAHGIALAVWTLVALGSGAMIFRRSEHRYGSRV